MEFYKFRVNFVFFRGGGGIFEFLRGKSWRGGTFVFFEAILK
jgi:hypothetical protein